MDPSWPSVNIRCSGLPIRVPQTEPPAITEQQGAQTISPRRDAARARSLVAMHNFTTALAAAGLPDPCMHRLLQQYSERRSGSATVTDPGDADNRQCRKGTSSSTCFQSHTTGTRSGDGSGGSSSSSSSSSSSGPHMTVDAPEKKSTTVAETEDGSSGNSSVSQTSPAAMFSSSQTAAAAAAAGASAVKALAAAAATYSTWVESYHQISSSMAGDSSSSSSSSREVHRRSVTLKPQPAAATLPQPENMNSAFNVSSKHGVQLAVYNPDSGMQIGGSSSSSTPLAAPAPIHQQQQGGYEHAQCSLPTLEISLERITEESEEWSEISRHDAAIVDTTVTSSAASAQGYSNRHECSFPVPLDTPSAGVFASVSSSGEVPHKFVGCSGFYPSATGEPLAAAVALELAPAVPAPSVAELLIAEVDNPAGLLPMSPQLPPAAAAAAAPAAAAAIDADVASAEDLGRDVASRPLPGSQVTADNKTAGCKARSPGCNKSTDNSGSRSSSSSKAPAAAAIATSSPETPDKSRSCCGMFAKPTSCGSTEANSSSGGSSSSSSDAESCKDTQARGHLTVQQYAVSMLLVPTLLLLLLLIGAGAGLAGKSIVARQQRAAAAAAAVGAPLEFEIRLNMPADNVSNFTPGEQCLRWFGAEQGVQQYYKVLVTAYSPSLNIQVANISNITCSLSSGDSMLHSSSSSSSQHPSLQIVSVISVSAPSEVSARADLVQLLLERSPSILAQPLASLLAVSEASLRVEISRAVGDDLMSILDDIERDRKAQDVTVDQQHISSSNSSSGNSSRSNSSRSNGEGIPDSLISDRRSTRQQLETITGTETAAAAMAAAKDAIGGAAAAKHDSNPDAKHLQATAATTSTAGPARVMAETNTNAAGTAASDLRPYTAAVHKPLSTSDETPACPFTPDRANAVSDAHGRLWGWHNGQSCAFKWQSVTAGGL